MNWLAVIMMCSIGMYILGDKEGGNETNETVTFEDTEEVKDERVSIINEDTGDKLDGFQFKKAICEDYLLGKGGG